MTALASPPRADAAADASSGLPRPARVAALALAVLVLALAAVGRATTGGRVALPGTAPVTTRALLFADRPDGGVDVRDAATGAAVGVIPPGDGGFARGALRALARGRRQQGVPATVPFHLARWSDGRLTLDDSATGSHVELGAFGGTNAAAFAAMLSPAPHPGERRAPAP